MQYLKEVFGCCSVDEVGRLTWEVIEENAKDKTAPSGNGYPLDRELLSFRAATRSEANLQTSTTPDSPSRSPLAKPS